MRQAFLVTALLCVNLFGSVLGDFEVVVPRGLKVHQQALSDGTYILGLDVDSGHINVMVKRAVERFDAEAHFFNGVKVMRSPYIQTLGNFDWWMADTRKVVDVGQLRETNYSTVFYVEEGGWLIFGTSTHVSRLAAQENAQNLLSAILPKARSLTGPDYTGKKFYLGWGAAMTGDPQMMHNEVKFDVTHTHNIFTNEVGGGYIGTTLIGPKATNRKAIQAAWSSIGQGMTAEDMFVQYSSGHGSVSGLAVGVDYDEIRDNTLKYPARELIVFIMACYSGNLVESFNAKKSVWGDWASKGRTLMVFASSGKAESSSTGPGTDPDEGGGPEGSAGSAFGYSLWKSLIGYSDGVLDGVKDGYISLGEIEKYTIQKTFEVGDHRPVSTGVYNSGLIINKVPPKEFLAQYDHQMSEAELMDALHSLDAEMRVQ